MWHLPRQSRLSLSHVDTPPLNAQSVSLYLSGISLSRVTPSATKSLVGANSTPRDSVAAPPLSLSCIAAPSPPIATPSAPIETRDESPAGANPTPRDSAAGSPSLCHASPLPHPHPQSRRTTSLSLPRDSTGVASANRDSARDDSG
jgi:hypothetical protein